jgi:NADH-quinone oxidoreductase subunit G
VLKVLADLLELPGFHFLNSVQVASEISNQSHRQKKDNNNIDITVKQGMSVIWQKSPYAMDALSRHANSLQSTKIGKMHHALMNKTTAKKLELSAGEHYLGMPVLINESVVDHCVFVNASQSTGEKL